ncbi:MAG: DUF308 domain-containing protein [Eubacteriales bacterium]
MKLFGTVTGFLVTIFGISIMFNPFQTFEIIDWMIGIVLLCNGLSMLFDGLRKGNPNRSKVIIGIVTTILGIVLLVTDSLQTLTTVIVVYLVAGGIMVSGLIECILGYLSIKKGNPNMHTLIIGIFSFVIGLAGLIFQSAAARVIDLFMGYHVVRIGLTILFATLNMDKPKVINLEE